MLIYEIDSSPPKNKNEKGKNRDRREPFQRTSASERQKLNAITLARGGTEKKGRG